VDINAQKNYRNFRAEAAYLYSESRYVTGERIPQVPKHQGSAQLSYDRRRLWLDFGSQLRLSV